MPVKDRTTNTPESVEAFAAWLRATIQKSPYRRSHSKPQQLEVGTRNFGLTPYAAGITRTRVIATLRDKEASRVWTSVGLTKSDCGDTDHR